MNFITKLQDTTNTEQVLADLNYLLSQRPWPSENFTRKSGGNQLGITHRPNATDVFLDADGSLLNKETGEILGHERDFTEINPLLPEYTRALLKQLADSQGIQIGRARFMRLMPKTGLSIHADAEPRYHLVLKTNPFALFGEYTGETVAAQCYHIPADGHFYKVDTTRPHFVFNGGWEPRIHLVICDATNSDASGLTLKNS